MKITRSYSNGITVEIEGNTQAEVFEQLASCDEVFRDTTCKAKMKGEFYKSDDVVFRVRKDDEENKYYELVCLGSDEPKLSRFVRKFGAHKKGGTLFPKYKVPENHVVGFAGWCKFIKDSNDENKRPKSDSDSGGDIPF